MSSSNTYAITLGFIVTHDHYPTGNIPLTFAPTGKTGQYIKEGKLLFRALKLNHWVILSIPGDERLPDHFTVTLSLHPTTATFHLVTGGIYSPSGDKLWQIEKIRWDT